MTAIATKTLDSINPATGDIVGTVDCTEVACLDTMIAAGRAAAYSF